ncbi:hypothetical protein LRP50_18450 [Enterovibrio sp. ZSDZ42]|uniref:Peptidase C39 domain-containing protein n=1 Tax=Enterovibrio gelatinilyticus TaxID=2899819 RepID=A0ABT5R4B1_9GAMM|nr:hypothetical protein [Enterovibrio sp. ZSDZ42]MDD1795113.1 hypothetical protein [Enterovibrio sp. ZSDZ42]
MHKDFPNLKQPDGSISCGAYSLTACLDVMGLLPVPHRLFLYQIDLSKGAFVGEQVVLEPTDSLTETAEKIYLVTGIIDQSEYSKLVQDSGLNAISAMAYVLMCFGVKPQIILRDESTYNQLAAAYPQELRMSNALDVPILCGMDNLAIDDDSYLMPTAVFHRENLHVVAMKPDGVWFDPEQDERPDWPALVNWDSIPESELGHEWLGVTLRIPLSQTSVDKHISGTGHDTTFLSTPAE